MKTKTLALLLAAAALALTGAVIAQDDASPDEVEIGAIAHWFEPVLLTHADHADMLDCIECHHQGGAEDPGLCTDCHMEEFDPDEPETPSLKLAYHLNCVGCHREAGSGPVACADCHERAALPEGPALEGYPEE